MSSESLFRDASTLFPGGVNSPVRYYEPYPRFMASASGARIRDVDGKAYIDHCLAFGPMILGHGNEKVRAALHSQIDAGILYGAPSQAEISLGRLIREGIPSIEMMRFTNSGTEATMHALRLARHFTGRDLILKVSGGFHGSHQMALEAQAYREGSEPPRFSTVEVEYNNTDEIQSAFRTLGKRIAAFITEPVLGNVGVVPPDIQFLKAARELTTEYDSLLIFDEVITGFRSSYGGFQDSVGIRPDLTTLGKIIGGGLPVGLFGGRRDIMEEVAPRGKFYQQGTFSGNPVSMAAGQATLSLLREMDYSVPSGYVKKLAAGVQEIMGDAGIDIHLNSWGTMFTIFFSPHPVTDGRSAEMASQSTYGKFFRALLDLGVFIPKSQMEACFASFAHTKEDLEEVLGAVSRASSRLVA